MSTLGVHVYTGCACVHWVCMCTLGVHGEDGGHQEEEGGHQMGRRVGIRWGSQLRVEGDIR